MNCMQHVFMKTPVGRLLLVADERALTHVSFAEGRGAMAAPEGSTLGANAVLEQAERELAEYFAGVRRDFTVALAPAGTEFQLRVWQWLQRIPYGVTWSYGELAKRVGKPTASRAVGAANGRNPHAIIVPCHRVIGASGDLTGYGGGMERKRILLEFEGVLLA